MKSNSLQGSKIAFYDGIMQDLLRINMELFFIEINICDFHQTKNYI
jgi:spore maturation protein CgeB